jgi:hypothetical protein
MSTKMAQTIVAAVELQRSIKESTEKLDALKATIRSEAEKIATKRKDDSLVEFESPVGTASVCFVKDAVSVIKGVNLHELKEIIPAQTWEHLFEEKIVLSSGFDVKHEVLPTRVQGVLKKYVEWNSRAPRVTLPK